ncbi:MAG: VCBS repeat-containing protein [Chloroflexota bacterium]
MKSRRSASKLAILAILVSGLLACRLTAQSQALLPATPEPPGTTPPLLTDTPLPTDTSAVAPTLAVTAAQANAQSGPQSVPETIDPALCVPPAEVDLPDESPPFETYGELFREYLSAGGSPIDLAARLQAWGAIDDEAGFVLGDADFTGDGVYDVLVDVRNLDQEVFTPSPPGDMFIYVCDDGAYGDAFQVLNDPVLSIPDVLSAEDINGDGQRDVLYQTINCGAHTCFTNLGALTWSEDASTFVSLLARPVSEPSAEVSLADLDGNGIIEVVVDTGYIGSVGAGVQRTFRDVYAWDGEAYVRASREVTSSQHPIHLINDADALLVEGRYEEAITLYLRSYTDDSLDRTFSPYMGWQTDLESYARYKTMLADVMLGDREAAQDVYDQLQADFPDELAAGGLYAAYARRFWDNYTVTLDVGAACGAVVAPITENDMSNNPVNQFGYANTFYQPEDMCPFVEP